jgi:two-component system, response regulator PdtaR
MMVSDASVAADEESAVPIIILVVEDWVGLRMPVAHYLRGSGYTVIESSNAQDALEVIASGIRIHLVFSDIQMPGDLNGIALAKHLEIQHPDLPVILTSGDATVKPAVPSGPLRQFLRKPYELDALERRIAALVGKASDP